jgi:hypothetical protein
MPSKTIIHVFVVSETTSKEKFHLTKTVLLVVSETITSREISLNKDSSIGIVSEITKRRKTTKQR